MPSDSIAQRGVPANDGLMIRRAEFRNNQGHPAREHQQQFRDDTLVRSVGATDALSERNIIAVSMCRSNSPPSVTARRQSGSGLSPCALKRSRPTDRGHALLMQLGAVMSKAGVISLMAPAGLVCRRGLSNFVQFDSSRNDGGRCDRRTLVNSHF